LGECLALLLRSFTDKAISARSELKLAARCGLWEDPHKPGRIPAATGLRIHPIPCQTAKDGYRHRHDDLLERAPRPGLGSHLRYFGGPPPADQYKLAIGGYKTVRRFACLGADVAEARAELKDEMGYVATLATDAALHRTERLGLAMLTDAWKAAQCHVERENHTRAEAKSHQLPVPVAPTTRVAMRKAIEALPSIGKIADREAPGAQYLSQKMEEVEQHMPTGSSLDEVVSVEDNDDYQLGPALDPTGAFRVIRKKMKVCFPKNNEELRSRLRVEGYTWMCLATKFPSRKWLSGQQQICWGKYVDYILGPAVASLSIR
jgi:hypothetical protein